MIPETVGSHEDIPHTILYEVDHWQTIAVLPPGTEYSIRCDCKMKVLAGEIFMNGFVMSSEAGYNNACSMDTHSRLTMFVQGTNSTTLWDDIVESKDIDQVIAAPAIKTIMKKPHGAVLSIRRRSMFIQSLYSNVLGPSADESIVDSVEYFQLFSSMSKAVVITEEWAVVADQVNEFPKVSVCGPQNSGKSSFCRYLVNTFLSKHKKVLFLETDIGQSELTPMGILSLSLIQTPLLGPPYSHATPVFTSQLTGNETNSITSLAYCLGVNAPANIIDSYTAKLKLLIKQAKSLKLPLIINNMGWTKGLGVLLHADILRLTAPDHVISLKTGRADLPPIQDLLLMDGMTTRVDEADLINPTVHDLIGHTNPNPENRIFPAYELRHMSVLSYFAPIYKDNKLAPPFKVNWKYFSLIVPEDVRQDLAAFCINASVVGLLGGDPTQTETGVLNIIEDDHRPCLGLGIIRAVDVNEHYLYINTPLTEAELEKVVVIKHTNIPVPHLPNTKCLPTPYLSNLAAHEIMGAGSRTQRNNLKRKYVAQD